MLPGSIVYFVFIGFLSNCEAFWNLPSLINNTENRLSRIKNSVYKCLDYYNEFEMVTDSMYDMWDRVNTHATLDMRVIKNVTNEVILDIETESLDTFLEMLTISTKIITTGNKIANRTFDVIAHPFQDVLHSAVTLLDAGGFPIVAAVQVVDFLDTVDERLHEINDVVIFAMKKIERVIVNMLQIACREKDAA